MKGDDLAHTVTLAFEWCRENSSYKETRIRRLLLTIIDALKKTEAEVINHNSQQISGPNNKTSRTFIEG